MTQEDRDSLVEALATVSIQETKGSLLTALDKLLRTIDNSESSIMIPTLLKDKCQFDPYEMLMLAKILKASILGHNDLVEFYMAVSSSQISSTTSTSPISTTTTTTATTPSSSSTTSLAPTMQALQNHDVATTPGSNKSSAGTISPTTALTSSSTAVANYPGLHSAESPLGSTNGTSATQAAGANRRRRGADSTTSSTTDTTTSSNDDSSHSSPLNDSSSASGSALGLSSSLGSQGLNNNLGVCNRNHGPGAGKRCSDRQFAVAKVDAMLNSSRGDAESPDCIIPGDPTLSIRLLLQIEQLKASIKGVTSLLENVVELYNTISYDLGV